MEQVAHFFAYRKHKGQLDDSGLPYFDAHILNVVNIIKNVTTDVDVICAAYLHDTIEDTETTYEEIKEEFGKRVADLVMEVTHDGQKDNVGYYFPRLKSQEGIMIKLADRLSNISRMEAWDISRREHYLKKTRFWKNSPNDKTR
jgi:(p)ppGpp synthase/HD superfamily hydrolase